MTNGVESLREVRLLGLPLPVFQAAQEAGEELQREFALIALQRDRDRENVPGRLLQLIGRLRGEYGDYTAGVDAQIEQALARGDTTIDVVFHVPESAGAAAVELGALIDEAEAFCRTGHLLTLVPQPTLVAFRRWYLGEFIRQLSGQPPTPWSGPTSP